MKESKNIKDTDYGSSEPAFNRRRFIKSMGVASGTLMVGGLMVGAKPISSRLSS